MVIKAANLHFSELRDKINACPVGAHIRIEDCLGQRYIASGHSADIEIIGTPGNALGAYLAGGKIVVRGSAQDATGDTMDDGEIVIYGSSGDATGYAMRGGRIFVRDNAGYRAGIHMKAYGEKIPVIVIGGRGGYFLGEYQAGGKIIVLGLNTDGKPVVGEYCGTGMHGGEIVIRSRALPPNLPPQVTAAVATAEDMKDIVPEIKAYCKYFSIEPKKVLDADFFILRPNTANPYKQLYTYN
ncbi:MAG: glutamate synthase [Clostridiales bacterium]|jgi:glutamate synthase domain-containing protein 3|nr:glutamate synthase [Clostridiales bacterium]